MSGAGVMSNTQVRLRRRAADCLRTSLDYGRKIKAILAAKGWYGASLDLEYQTHKLWREYYDGQYNAYREASEMV